MSKQYTCLFFDLDGTLADSEAGILRSMQYAIRQMNLPARSDADLRVHVGAPLREMFEQEFGISAEAATQAVKEFRAYYIPNESETHPPFEGVTELLNDLKKAGRHLALATSKPTEMAEKVLKGFGILDVFDVVYGSNMDNSRASKTEVLEAAMAAMTERTGAGKADMLMIGDKHYDVEAASQLGIDVAGVLYGYGTEAEMEACKPTYTIKTVEELRMFLLNEYLSKRE